MLGRIRDQATSCTSYPTELARIIGSTPRALIRSTREMLALLTTHLILQRSNHTLETFRLSVPRICRRWCLHIRTSCGLSTPRDGQTGQHLQALICTMEIG